MTPSMRTLHCVLAEYESAVKKYPEFNSAHEGFAVLWEEVDELWDEVKKKPSDVSLRQMREEAIQVAAMALRFIEDCCALEGG